VEYVTTESAMKDSVASIFNVKPAARPFVSNAKTFSIVAVATTASAMIARRSV
jgi:hypothetical protein